MGRCNRALAMARYGGTFSPKLEADAVEEAAEVAKMAKGARSNHFHGKLPTVQQVVRQSVRDGEVPACDEPKYSGAYAMKDTSEVDFKAGVEKACHAGCHHAWEEYEKCELRIEKKGQGECTGYYMDYFHCIDQCSSKLLFKTLV